MAIGILDKPRLGPLKILLRPYQDEAVAAVRSEFVEGKKRSTLLVMATGGGKTLCFGMITRKCIERGGKVLILAHRNELIEQAVQKLDLLGVEAAVEKADQEARSLFEPDAVVATVQTLQRKRLESWPRDYFKMIITDEAHHSTSKSYQQIYKHFKNAYHLGVTATSDRADDDQLGDVFESVAYEFSLWDAMRAPYPGPYLCRIKFVQCEVDIDLRDIRTTGGDFNQADLEERIRPLIDVLANATRQEIRDRRTLIFTPDVGSAQAMATALRSMDLNAQWTSGDDKERKQKIKDFRDGKIQILVNCNIATEGFDVPEVSAIVLCRPTKSRTLYAQMVGRCTRLHESKDHSIIVDFNYLTTKHDLVKPVELFDTKSMDSEVLAIAQDLIGKDKQLDLTEAIERGEAIHQERQVLRVQAREREVRYRKVMYDPLSVAEAIGVPWRGSRAKDAVIHRATEAQINALKKWKIDNPENMSKAQASTMLDMVIRRANQGLASHKMVRILIRNGVDPETARNISYEDAHDRLDGIFGNRRD